MLSIRSTCDRSWMRPSAKTKIFATLWALLLAASHVRGQNVETSPATADAAATTESETVVVSEKAKEIHFKSYIFDGHNDLPWAVRSNGSRSFEVLDISKPQPELHTDIERLKQGGVGAQYWSVYVPANTAESGKSHQMTLEQIEIVKAMCEKYPDVFAYAESYDDIIEARKQGKIASLIGVEGGHSIENSIEKLRRLYKLGARYMTLTHSDTLDWADSCSDESKSGGLSAFGEEVVREMNRMGMLVDISHVSPETMQDALDISEAPVIFSHSSARGIADHPRNVPDEILKQLPDDGGVVMINFYSGFVVPEAIKTTRDMFERTRALREKYGDDEESIRRESAAFRAKYPVPRGTVHDLADHIDHVVKLAGVEHVGIGSDYDGVGRLPKQMDDVSTYPVLTQVLLDRGYSESDIHKIMSENVLRVIQAAEVVATKLQAD
ncbi:MAG: membrane dipeptidase [Pirellulaceae bacterium]